VKKILLHICCGVCASSCVENLHSQGFYVVGFFFNPNIHPFEEYQRRKENLKLIKEKFSLEIIEGEYNPREWFKICKEYAKEREGGRRCLLCYEFRLKETQKLCKSLGFDFFTTTLTVSPHKKAEMVFSVGKKLDEKRFLEIDFKKKDGFKKAMEFAKKYNLYRQDYCGCVYSFQERKWRKDFTPLTNT